MSRPARPSEPRRGGRGRRRGAAFDLALLVALTLALTGLAGLARAQTLQALPTGLAASAASIERAATEAFAGPDRTGKDGPLARVGLDLARIYAASTEPGGVDALRAASGVDGAPFIRDERVLIDATAVGTGAELLRDLEAIGLERGVAFGRVASGELPIDAIPRAAALTGLRSAAPARAAPSEGSVDGLGDEAMRADLARLTFGVDGSGVSVGTLSDSYDCSPSAVTSAADDVASGDLPMGVVVLQELGTCTGAIDEGRAMMQLIHDVAPGASQLFHTAFEGQADFAQGILDLEAAGADVIVDDVFYFAEPMFQDGIIAQAADQVAAAGVPYFSSVGNQADASYESAFRPATATGTFATSGYASVHDFDPGPGVDTVQEIVIDAGATATIVLQWDDPFASVGIGNPGATGDVDLFVTDTAGASIVTSSVDDNIAGGDPVEIVQVTNAGGTPASAGIVIGFFGGAEPTLLKYLHLGAMSVEEYATDSPTGSGHPNAAGAMAVGAAYYLDTPAFGQEPPQREAFSSLGGVPIFFDVNGNRLAAPVVRPKPEITAPDGTDTTFFGSDSDGTGFPNFFGTSAAAPHAAAVAALLLDLAPTLAPAEVYAALQDTATDMDAPGFDFWTGYGLIQADAALLTVTGAVGFDAASYDATEGAGTVTLTVRRTGGAAGAISVDYATRDDTATAGSDYAPTTGTLTWPDGDASPRTIDVPLVDDTDPEGDETLDVILERPVGTTLDRARATVTVREDDATTLTVAAGPASPGAAQRSRVGEAATVLQLALAAPSDAQPATIDALSATVTVEGAAGAPTDVAEVRLHLDADGDGAIDAGSAPVAVAAPDADGALLLAPTGVTVAAGEERFLLVELVFGGSLATLPSGAPLAALALPFLIGFAGTRRRRLVGLALLLVVVAAACSGPPPRSADVTIEIVTLDASSTVPGVSVATSGLPIEGSTVTVRE